MEKLHDYTGLPSSKKIMLSPNKSEKLKSLLTIKITKTMNPYEIKKFANKFLKIIINSLIFMPQSVRYLLKTIEISYIKQVLIKLI